MPSENNPEVQYELFEDKKAIKFMDNHFHDEKLIKRIYDKYHLLSGFMLFFRRNRINSFVYFLFVDAFFSC